MRRFRAVVLLTFLPAAGCGGDALLLNVEVKTDLTPGLEFTQVRTELRRDRDEIGGVTMTQSATASVAIGQDFLTGRRVAEFELPHGGTYLVEASLLGPDGSVLVSREVRVSVKKTLTVTILLTRSCAGVDCPLPGDDPSATTCYGGRCVPPDCAEAGGEECGPPDCEDDSECTTLVDCAEGRCLDDACVQVPRAGGCDDGEWCSAERGCLPLPGDGGVECIPEAEACNGTDDDCDGAVDEDFDLGSDTTNCGSCGNICGDAHATPSCTSGTCTLTCDEGWADCNGDPADGCEADLASAASCGACGTTCEDPTPLCVGSGTGFSCESSCPPSSPTLCGSSCVDTDTSLAHCGGCDSPCDPAHGTGTCTGGRCGVADCDDGWADCNGDPSDGCEVDLGDPAHCGACGTSCPASTPYCVRSGGSYACTDGCSDGVRGGDETDVDCGGSLCDACELGDMCGTDADCGPALECSGGVCVACGVCAPGTTDTQPCGNCGMRSRTCTSSCDWGSWSACSGEGPCSPGSVDRRSCGNCGTQTRTCDSSCNWNAWGTCTGEGTCSPGAVDSESCGNCGTRTRTCTSSCSWGSWGGCTGEGVCTPGATEAQSCGNCGTRTRTCTSSCTWGSWGSCTGEGVCSPGAVDTTSCGNCGTASRTCTSTCDWGPFGSCMGEGSCSPGSTTSSGCYNSCQQRTCSSSCEYPAAPDGCTGCSCSSLSGVCGSSCPANYHVTRRSYRSACGACCSDNSVDCAPNCGSSFTTCGIGCPSGYHPTAYDYSSACGSCCSNNSTRCALNAGSSFTSCGSSCPSGYVVTGRSYSPSCGSCCSDNSVTCRRI